METEFKKGDRVRVIDPNHKSHFGRIFYISHRTYPDARLWSLYSTFHDDPYPWFYYIGYFGEKQLEIV